MSRPEEDETTAQFKQPPGWAVQVARDAPSPESDEDRPGESSMARALSAFRADEDDDA